MKVWVTRDEESDGPLSSALRAAGLEVVHEPVLQRRVVTDAADVISQLGPDDWLVLTSVYAVEAVAAEPARAPRVAVVGEASRQAALAKGLRVELVSSDGTGKTLFKQLTTLTQARSDRPARRPSAQHIEEGKDHARLPPRRTCKVCYPRSSLASPPNPWPGVELLSPVLYETLPRPFDRTVIERVDVVCVVSPSAVEAVGPVALPFASIGPTTSTAIRKLGKDPWVEAPQPNFDSLTTAIAKQTEARP